MNKILLFLVFGIFLSSVAMAQTDSLATEKVYTSVETVPSFPGGLNAFYNFLGKNVQYPVEAVMHHTQGKVIVSFVVEKNGRLSNVTVTKGIGSGCDEEAARVLKHSPKWKPGTQGGKPVRVAYSVPISFSLTN
ncbi:energy transducer TonB [Mucilaginibacter flavidus]|uniref:energy transducer TonB n=1 Tax=Mucilaginibacter flavidus TaxID=2949309 RepID=UPI0020938E69|nr:energy transducer TonB [Mucilaginibacter flavidus]MCO5947713.1 energy transducer TonB [Mucilaginibacter flavidus]